MKCKKIQNILMSDYVDEELDQSLSENIQEHLEKCFDCKHLYQQIMNETVLPFEKAPVIKAPDALWHKIEQKMDLVGDDGYQEINLQGKPFSFSGSFFYILKKTSLIVSIGFVVLIVISMFHLKNKSYRPSISGYEIKNEKEFHYIFSRNRIDLSEEEDGFGTAIEDLFL